MKKGCPLTAEHRAKIGLALKGRRFPFEHHAALRGRHLGRQLFEHRAAISFALIGRKRGKQSIEHRTKIAKGIARAHARGDYWRGPTSLEYALQLLLENADLAYEAQRRFGRYVVDFYVSSRGLAFEADGEPWHTWLEQKRPGYTAKRDQYLKSRGIIAVVHLTPNDLDPWIIK